MNLNKLKTQFNQASPNEGEVIFNHRMVLICGLLLAVMVLIFIRNLNIPHSKPIMNFDEAAYAAIALEYIENGEFSNRRIFPAGFYENGSFAVVHTLLSPYLQRVLPSLEGKMAGLFQEN